MRTWLPLGTVALFVLALVAGPVAAQQKIPGKKAQIQPKRIQIQGKKKIQVQPKRIQIKGKKVQLQPIALARGGGDLNLIKNKDVQADLKITMEQSATIAKLVEKQKADLQGIKGKQAFKKRRAIIQASDKAAKDLLTMAQAQRLDQLKVQQRGPAAFYDKKIANTMDITAQQRKMVMDTIRGAAKKRQQIVKQFKGKGNIKKRQEQLAKLNQELVGDIVKKLTPKQQQKWRDMTGKPFDGVLPRGGGFGAIIIRPGAGQIRPLPLQPKGAPKKKKIN